MFAALVKAMGHQDEHGRVLRLEELCLRDSRLDNATLPLLAQLVSMAGNDLRDLDLSENSFTIDSGPSTAAWEIFLDSLASSCVLRRIDLSGNGLGPRAFEIFTRVYARECPIDPMLLTEGDVTRTIQDFGELQLRARGMSDLSNTNLSDAHLEADHAAIPGGNEHSRHG